MHIALCPTAVDAWFTLLLACRGPLAAAADALGRVMLLDAASGAVLHVLKGALHAHVESDFAHTRSGLHP